jgi:hypothetical protein
MGHPSDDQPRAILWIIEVVSGGRNTESVLFVAGLFGEDEDVVFESVIAF